MIARGYYIHVYCDRGEYCERPKLKHGMFDFYGESKSECFKQARASGWHFRANHYVICEHCWQKGHRP